MRMKRAATVERNRNRREPASLRSCLYTPFSSRHWFAVRFSSSLCLRMTYVTRARVEAPSVPKAHNFQASPGSGRRDDAALVQRLN
jgi:hypothetical protein